MLITVHGTQQLHAFLSVEIDMCNTIIYFVSPNHAENCVICVLKDIIEFKDVTGFVICMITSGG
jgi:hypothetical protein